MRMTWDDLQTVEALVRAGSVVGAARELSLRHSSISRRVDALERSLGAAEFEEVLSLVAEDLEAMSKRLQDALGQDDTMDIRKALHKLAGFAAQFSLDDLARSAKTALSETPAYDAAKVEIVLENLRGAMEAVEKLRGVR